MKKIIVLLFTFFVGMSVSNAVVCDDTTNTKEVYMHPGAYLYTKDSDDFNTHVEGISDSIVKVTYDDKEKRYAICGTDYYTTSNFFLEKDFGTGESYGSILTIDDKSYLYKMPKEKSDKVDETPIPSGTELEIYNTINQKFYAVVYNGKKGFVYGDFLSGDLHVAFLEEFKTVLSDKEYIVCSDLLDDSTCVKREGEIGQKFNLEYYYPADNVSYYSILENGKRLWLKNPSVFIVINSIEGLDEDIYLEVNEPIDVYRDKELKDKVATLEVGSQFERIAFKVGSTGTYMIKYNDKYYFIGDYDKDKVKGIDSITKENPAIESNESEKESVKDGFNFVFLIPIAAAVVIVIVILLIGVSKMKKVEAPANPVVQQQIEQPVMQQPIEQPVVQQVVESTPVVQQTEEINKEDVQ